MWKLPYSSLIQFTRKNPQKMGVLSGQKFIWIKKVGEINIICRLFTPESAISSQLSQISSSSSSAAILTSVCSNTREQTIQPLTEDKSNMAAKVAGAESSKEVEDSISRGSIEVCRLMHPDDANLAGNVHGGTILKLIEEGGFIIATRHCNRNRTKDEPVLAALARVERTDFIQPMFIGEVAQVHVQLGYASKRSLEVKASVWAENVLTGSRRLTNRASLWYVPIVMGSDVRIIPEVPSLEYSSKDEEEKGKERYELQKRARLDKEEHFQEVLVRR